MTTGNGQTDTAGQLKQALSALREMRSRLESVERARTEPIAIVGMGCRVPGADGPDAFWDLLRDGVDAITETPADRWDNAQLYDPDPLTPGTVATRWGGYLTDIDRFDAGFFGIAPREAAQMDPQHRLLLEVAYEALEDAGRPVEHLSGTRTGVFVGLHSQSNDYFLMQAADTHGMDLYSGTGTSHSVAAGRLSYQFDFQGPCVTVDTACSSSLVAIHLAVQSLRRGESDLALAGGVNVLLDPAFTIAASRMQMLAPDGRCKTFDAAADGFVRSEGCGMVALKRLSDALADGDPVRAVIYGSAINQDGHSNGLTAPNGMAQQTVIRDALRDGRIEPKRVGYVEAHGTGTSLGDPIEVESLAEVLGSGGSADQRCFLGSAKANLGHLEGAAGVTGLIKTVLTLRHGQVPPLTHFQTLNPHISLNGSPLSIPTELTSWPAAEQPRIAGVSSFGWSGTNAHVVLGDPPVGELSPPENPRDFQQGPVILPISARSEPALQALAGAYAARLRDPDAPPLTDLAFTAATRRSQLPERLGATGDSHQALAERLEAFASGLPVAGIARATAPARAPRLAFVFPGQGGQWVGMGLRLMATEPVFEAALARCAAAIEAETGWSLLDVLRAPTDVSQLDEIDVVQPAIFAMQVALAELLGSWGIQPDVVVGHSLGEVVAAHVGGILSLEDAATVICRRSRLMKRVAGRGGMGVVALTFDEARDLATRYGDRLAVAATNGPSTTVLSGDPDALDEALAAVQADGRFARRVQVDVASHSAQVEPLLQELRETLAGIAPGAARTSFASTVTGSYLSGPELDAAYWARNLRQPVLFGPVVDKLLTEGDTVFLELSPHPVLLGALEDAIEDVASSSTAFGALRRAQDEAETVREAVAALWTAGLPVDWDRLVPGRVSLPLPGYPWQRERYWIDAPRPNRSAIGLAQATETRGQWLGSPLPALAHLPGSRFWLGLIDPQEVTSRDAREALPVLPGVAAVLIASRACGGPVEQLTIVTQALLTAPLETQTALVAASGQAEIQIHTRPVGADEWSLWATARPAATGPVPATLDIAALKARLTHQATLVEGIDELWAGETESLARLGSPVEDEQTLSGSLDLVFRLAGEEPGLVLDAIEQADVLASLGSAVWVYACHGATTDSLDAYLLAPDGAVVGHVLRGRFAAPSDELLEQASIERLDNWLYTYSWQPAGVPDREPVPTGDWLVLTGEEAGGREIAAAIEARGARADTLTVTETDLVARVNQIRDAIAADGRSYAGILDARTLSPTPEDIEFASERVAYSALDVAQAIAGLQSDAMPRLWFVTRGAQPVKGPPRDPAAAGLWGFGRVVANEHPEFWGGLVDLDPDTGDDDASMLVDAILTAGDEGEIAVRGNQRYVARLVQAEPGDTASTASLELRDDATYLITGGAGAIGLALARWMVGAGARQLALVGRSELRPDAISVIEELRQSGATVRYLRGDIGCRKDVAAIFAAITGEMPDLRGIVHAAGVLSDATLLQQSPEMIHTVFTPKVAGASHLVEAARDQELDFLALFSSVSALLGVPGQSNYAAANAVLDAYAHSLRSEGVPAVSIAWGRWGEIGLATRAESAASLDRLGIIPMPPAAGVAAYERVMMSGATHVAVLDIDWPAYFGRDSVIRPRFSETASRAGLDRAQPEIGLRATLDAMDEAGREEILLDHVRSLAAAVLRFDGPQRVLPAGGFFQIGMDSLTAVELKNRLQQSLDLTLPATIAFDYPTPLTLASRLHELMYPPSGSEVAASAVDDDLNGFEEVSREELRDLLEAELELLNEELGR